MKSINVCFDGRFTEQILANSVEHLQAYLYNYTSYLNGKIVNWKDFNLNDIEHNSRIIAKTPVLGGKGGFGSLLRAFGKQILISNNKEACRDLNGRRMRDVNNEKKLKEWLLSQAKNQQSKEEAKLERLERKRRNPPRHFFEDVKYKRQKEAIERELNDAIDHGFQLLADQKCAKANLEKRRDCTSALRLIGIPEELDDDEDEEDEIICISQELYDKLIASDNNLTEIVNNYTISDDNKPAENGGESILECSSSFKAPSCNNILISNEDAKSDKVSISKDKNQFEQYEKLDLKSLSTIDHYLSLGPDRLKLELKQRGLKCGGTLTQRAERLWTVRDLSSYPKQLMAKQSKLTHV